MRVPVYRYVWRCGTSYKNGFTFRDQIDGGAVVKAGELILPEGSETKHVGTKRKNEVYLFTTVLVPRPGIGRFVSFNAEDAMNAAIRGSFGMQWEPEIS
jgi:hypothetical protein